MTIYERPDSQCGDFLPLDLSTMASFRTFTAALDHAHVT